MSLSEQVAALKLTSRKGGPDVRRLIAAFQSAAFGLPPPFNVMFTKPQVHLHWKCDTRSVVLFVCPDAYSLLVDTSSNKAPRYWEPGHRFHPDFEWGVHTGNFAECEVGAVVVTLQQLLCSPLSSNPQEQLSAFMRYNICGAGLWSCVRDLLQTAHVGSPKRWSVDIVDGKSVVVLRWPRTRLVVTDTEIRIEEPHMTWRNSFVDTTSSASIVDPKISTFIVDRLRSELRNDQLPAHTYRVMLDEFWAASRSRAPGQ